MMQCEMSLIPIAKSSLNSWQYHLPYIWFLAIGPLVDYSRLISLRAIGLSVSNIGIFAVADIYHIFHIIAYLLFQLTLVMIPLPLANILTFCKLLIRCPHNLDTWVPVRQALLLQPRPIAPLMN